MCEQKVPLISVVVPVYNVEKYLNRCLDSIVSQTYHNLEIILVDDGSTDSSLEICEEYAKKDTRIKVFHKENGGLSDARNYGIEYSRGEYITFVDSDDKVTDDYVEFLWKLTENGKYKMSVCSLYNLYTDNNHLVEKGSRTREVLSAKQCIEKMCYADEVDTCAYAKMIYRDLFQTIRFPKGKWFEDIGTIYLLFDANTEIACGFSPKYYYCIRPNSIVTGSFSDKKLDMLEMTDQMASFVNERYPDLKLATLRRQVYARFSTLNQMASVDNMDAVKNELISFIHSHAKEVMNNRKAPRRDKLAIISLRMGYGFYKRLWSIYLKLKSG